MQTKIGRRNFLKKMGLGVAALAMPKLTHGANRARKPNLLFVFADQFRRQAMGFMNADPAITPNFDNFAKEAMVFTNAISSFPLCSPFRATLMTGCFALSTAITTNCQPGLNPGWGRLGEQGRDGHVAQCLLEFLNIMVCHPVWVSDSLLQREKIGSPHERDRAPDRLGRLTLSRRLIRLRCILRFACHRHPLYA